MRRAIAVLVTAPIVLLGSVAAHQLAYLLADPAAAPRARRLAETGHGYLAHVPLMAIACGTVVAIGCLLALRAELAGPGAVRARAWPYALAAPAGFAIQEHAERLAATGHVPFGAVLEPTFLPGLAMQLPFALLAWAVAWLVLRSARTVALAVRRRRSAAPRRTRQRGVLPAPASRPRVSVLAVLATSAAGRAPPA